VLESLEKDDNGDQFLELVSDLRKDHAGSPYAAMASLAEARYQVENDRLAEAETALRWAVDKGSLPIGVPRAQGHLPTPAQRCR